MSTPSRDPSIEHEPHLQPGAAEPDPSEERADRVLWSEAARQTDDDLVEHTVWDEPTLEVQSTEAPEGELTYARWLGARIEQTSSAKTWWFTLLIVVAAGPWGVFGALTEGFASNQGGGFALVAVTIVGPVTEEIMKIAIALWVVEKRPYLFKSIPQILICAVAGGLAFAGIENLMYLNVYIPHAGFGLAAWRWTVCTGLHMNCSLVMGIGLARIWDNAVRLRQKPQLGLGMPWFFTAMAGHGLYNFLVFVAEMAGWLEF